MNIKNLMIVLAVCFPPFIFANPFIQISADISLNASLDIPNQKTVASGTAVLITQGSSSGSGSISVTASFTPSESSSTWESTDLLFLVVQPTSPITNDDVFYNPVILFSSGQSQQDISFLNTTADEKVRDFDIFYEGALFRASGTLSGTLVLTLSQS